MASSAVFTLFYVYELLAHSNHMISSSAFRTRHYSLRYVNICSDWRGHPCPGFPRLTSVGLVIPDSYLSDATIFLLTNLGYPGCSHHTQSCCFHSHFLPFGQTERTTPASFLVTTLPFVPPRMAPAREQLFFAGVFAMNLSTLIVIEDGPHFLFVVFHYMSCKMHGIIFGCITCFFLDCSTNNSVGIVSAT